ncbi:MAG: hypothetical protein JWN49_633, partial [Parcubacteria group bacterium]|nr:hypothetical protein [Parcubacteria group bacterium]
MKQNKKPPLAGWLFVSQLTIESVDLIPSLRIKRGGRPKESGSC